MKVEYRPSWPGGVSAPKAQTGWLFKIREESQRDTCRVVSRHNEELIGVNRERNSSGGS